MKTTSHEGYHWKMTSTKTIIRIIQRRQSNWKQLQLAKLELSLAELSPSLLKIIIILCCEYLSCKLRDIHRINFDLQNVYKILILLKDYDRQRWYTFCIILSQPPSGNNCIYLNYLFVPKELNRYSRTKIILELQITERGFSLRSIGTHVQDLRHRVGFS